MEGLRERELGALVEFAHDAAWVARFQPRHLEPWIVQRVGALVPSDAIHLLVGCPEPSHFVADDARIATMRNSSEGRDEWARLMGDHPLVAERLRQPRETRVLRLSDYVTQAQLRRLEVYDTFLRPFDLAYCATARFFGPSRAYDLACQRRRTDFHVLESLLLEVTATILGLAVREPRPPIPKHLEALGITKREAEVLDCLSRGQTNLEIAGDLSIAQGTVKKHLDNIFEKLGVRNRLEAARCWIITPSDSLRPSNPYVPGHRSGSASIASQ